MVVVGSFTVVGIVCSLGVVEDTVILIGAFVETVVDIEIVVIDALEVVIVVVIVVAIVIAVVVAVVGSGGGGVIGMVVIAVVVGVVAIEVVAIGVVVVRVVVVEMAFVCCIVVVKGRIVVGCCGHLSPMINKPDEQKQVTCDALLIEMKFDCSSEHKASWGPQIPSRLHIPINNK